MSLWKVLGRQPCSRFQALFFFTASYDYKAPILTRERVDAFSPACKSYKLRETRSADHRGDYAKGARPISTQQHGRHRLTKGIFDEEFTPTAWLPKAPFDWVSIISCNLQRQPRCPQQLELADTPFGQSISRWRVDRIWNDCLHAQRIRGRTEEQELPLAGIEPILRFGFHILVMTARVPKVVALI